LRRFFLGFGLHSHSRCLDGVRELGGDDPSGCVLNRVKGFVLEGVSGSSRGVLVGVAGAGGDDSDTAGAGGVLRVGATGENGCNRIVGARFELGRVGISGHGQFGVLELVRGGELAGAGVERGAVGAGGRLGAGGLL